MIMKKIQTYQGVDARNHRVQDKIEEDFIVCMTHTVIYPKAVMVLQPSDNSLAIIMKSKLNID